MGDLLFQINCFLSEILILIDEGKGITIEELEQEMDNGDIIKFIGKKYGFKNINSIPENQ